MPGVSRGDFLRIILPGAVAVGLLDIALRLVALTSGKHVSADTIEAFRVGQRLVEDPFRGTALALFVGLIAYFVDPGYASPSYNKDLPSEYLANFLKKRDVEVKNPPGLFFLLFDEFMSPELRDRALLYGQFFRVGVQIIVGSMFVAVGLPIAVLFVSTANADAKQLTDVLSITATGWRTVAPVTLVASALLLRRFSHERSRKRLGGANPGWTCALIFVLGVIGWLVAVQLPLLSPATGRLVALGSTLGAYACWLTARQAGPLSAVVKNLARGRALVQKSADPASSFDDFGAFALDCTIACTALTGLLVTSSALRLAQLAGTVAILAGALGVAYLRKHERQLSGVKSNQREWIDRNERLVVAIATGKPIPADRM